MTSRSPTRAGLGRLAAALVCAVLACAGCTAAPDSGATGTPTSSRRGPVTGSTSTSVPGRPSSAPTGPTTANAPVPGALRTGNPSTRPSGRPALGTDAALRASLRHVLDARAAAVAAGDPAAWLASLAQSAPGGLRDRQASAFDALSRLPITGWRYTGLSLEQPQSQSQGRVVAEVHGRYGLAGFWRGARTFTQRFTFSFDGAWRVSDLADGPGSRQPWQLPGLHVLTGRHSLVLGNVPTAQLQTYRDFADRAVGDVAKVWGSHWPERAVLIAPRADADYRALAGLAGASGRAGTDDQIAAVTVGPVVAGRRADADDIVVNPTAYDRLQPAGRRVVITHEVTHLATRSSTAHQVPTWLSEGLAEYVAWSQVRLPRATVAAALLARVRDGSGPSGLPGASAFRASSGQLEVAYNEAWLACMRLADRYGQGRLVALYRAAASHGGGDSPAASDEATDAAFRTVLGTTRARFTSDWLGYLHRLAGASG